MYKLRHVKFFYNIASDDTPCLIQNLVTWRESPYNLRGTNKAGVSQFFTNCMEHSIQYSGVVLSNIFSIILITYVKLEEIQYLRSLISTVYLFNRYPRDNLIFKFKIFKSENFHVIIKS